MRALTVALGALLCVCGAKADTVYRCGPDGRQFSDQPCAEGTALQVDDSRTPAQQREAAEAAQRDAALAAQMTDERHEREATAAARGSAARIGPVAAAPVAGASAAHPARKKPRRHGHRHTPAPEEDSARYAAPTAAKQPSSR